MAQLELWSDMNTADSRPLPLIVAGKWGFDLAYIERDEDGEYIYCARDWYIGLGGDKGRWSKSKGDWLSGSQPVEIDIKRPRRPMEKMEFIDAKGLYSIAARMINDKPQLAEIKEYLAHAGVKMDEYRINPGNAVDAAIGQYEAQGKDGFFIEERVMGKLANKAFRAALKESVAEIISDLQYAIAQNSIYRGLWNRTAAILKNEMGLKKSQSLRDNQNGYALAYQRLAEMVAAEKLGERAEITFDEADEVIYAVAEMIAQQANATSNFLGIDIATGKPLLKSGKAS